jgi:peroxiredoxin
MRLEDELKAFHAEWLAKAGPEANQRIEGGLAGLRSSFSNALKIGDIVADFTLPDAKGSPVRLSDQLRKGPIVLTFYRGGWCPYCNLELRAYQRLASEFQACGVSILAISPETPDVALTTAQSNALGFTVLSDVGNGVARQFGLVWRMPGPAQAGMTAIGKALPQFNGDNSWELPHPGTFLIAPDRSVRLAQVDVDYRTRPDPQAVLAEATRLAAALAAQPI